MDGRLALGPSQEGAHVLSPLPHMPQGSGPLGSKTHSHALIQSQSDKSAGLAIAPLYSGLPIPQPQLSQSSPSELSMTFKLCSPHHCPHLPRTALSPCPQMSTALTSISARVDLSLQRLSPRWLGGILNVCIIILRLLRAHTTSMKTNNSLQIIWRSQSGHQNPGWERCSLP